MTKDEALKMCLEYIETDAHERKYVRHAIKEALAQPEEKYQYGTPLLDAMTKDYVPPQRKWKNLRSSTINKLFVQTYRDGIKDGGQSFARAIEAKLKEINT